MSNTTKNNGIQMNGGTISAENMAIGNKARAIKTMSTTNGDIMTEKSETSSYNLSNAKFGGGFAAGGTQTGGTLNDYSSNQNLSEAAAEIQQILKQLEVTNPTASSAEKMIVAAKAVDEIENNAALKKQVIAALKLGGTEAFNQAINHPLAKNMMPIVQEWTEAE